MYSEKSNSATNSAKRAAPSVIYRIPFTTSPR
jgi:hypothetical protein